MQHRRIIIFSIRSVSNLPSRFSKDSLNQKLSIWMQKYEDFVGLSEVKAAQTRVLQAEKKFVKSQEDRREAQRHISTIQIKLHELHAELDRIPRGDDKYLTLITQEHAVIKDERRLREEFQQFEKEERENFAALSHTVRDSHEKERAQAEKTKYWSIIGSILGTMIGIFGTTFNNRLRMKELRDLVQDTASANGKNLNHAPIDVEALSKEISNSIKQQFAEYSSSALQSSHGEGEKRLQELLTQIQDSFVAQSNAHIQLETLLATHLTGEGNNKPLVLGERELTALLGVQKRDLTSLIVTSSILIPICTWALCKFLNL